MTKFFLPSVLALSLSPLNVWPLLTPPAQARDPVVTSAVNKRQAELNAQLREAYANDEDARIKHLIAQGADFKTLKNKQGQTALDLVKKLDWPDSDRHKSLESRSLK